MFRPRTRPGWRQFKTSQYVRQQAGQVVTLREHVPHRYLNRFRIYVGRQFVGEVRTMQDVERLVTEYIDNIAKPVL